MSTSPARAEPSDAVLELAGVGVLRLGRWILADIDWSLRAGERWVVVGPNGAGKTTLLAIAATTLFPSKGTVRVLGKELGHVDARPLRARIGLASAALADRVEPRIAAHDVVVTGRTGALAPWWDQFSAADHDRADSLLAGLGMTGFGSRAFGTLSTGERQRVVLARTLMPDPDLLLVDEPAAGLDLRAREELVDALGRLARAPRPLGIALVTHHLEEIPTGFGAALVLAGSRALAAGPIRDVLTDAVLSAAYGLPLAVSVRAGRWTARRA